MTRTFSAKWLVMPVGAVSWWAAQAPTTTRVGILLLVTGAAILWVLVGPRNHWPP